MFQMTVNGETVYARHDQKLLGFLREELGLRSVKDGCSQGACGTCTILKDGKAVRACVLTTAKAAGSEIITVEGLTRTEKSVYEYAFASVGAVQCGFCIPGMIICAKALLDINSQPSGGDIKQAIKNNICRCTGYKKIEEAIMLASKIFNNGGKIPQGEELSQRRIRRVDAKEKILGTAEYSDDIFLDGMLIGGALRSRYPRARVLSVNTEKAKALPGVHCVLTASELPGSRKVGHIKKDQYVLVAPGEITSYLGDAIALIAADSKHILEEARKLIKVEYEPLPAVFSPGESARADAPHVHEDGNLLSRIRLVRGEADERIKSSKHSVTNTYYTPSTEHAFLEPETAVAAPEGDGLVIFCGDQGIYQTRRECAEACGLEPDNVRVVAKMVGGGFGGKEDMSVQHHAAILALATKRAVKFSLSRDESILCHPKRHPMEIRMTTACDENGYLTAMKALIIADTGAFASLGAPVLQRACTHAAGPYNYQVIDIEGRAYYTNNPPSGAFRGFGVTQSCFAMESNLNLLAEAVGISPWEIRYRNGIRPGQILPNGQIADSSTALIETLEAVKPYYDSHPGAGIACAMKNAGTGVGLPDIGRCRLVVEHGVVNIYCSAACIGQGIGTVLARIVQMVTGLPNEKILYNVPDTMTSPDSGNTTASRQTVFSGEAARIASNMLAGAMEEGGLASLEGREFYGEYSGITDEIGSDKEYPISHVTYGFATQLVDLDGDGRLKYVLAAHDLGNAINPSGAEGQIEGGVVMGLGFALTEQFHLDNGRPTLKFGSLGLLRSTQVPQIDTVLIEHGNPELALGAKGLGEICSIPTAPAVSLAYYNRDGEFRTKLPLNNTPYSRPQAK